MTLLNWLMRLLLSTYILAVLTVGVKNMFPLNSFGKE